MIRESLRLGDLSVRPVWMSFPSSGMFFAEKCLLSARVLPSLMSFGPMKLGTAGAFWKSNQASPGCGKLNGRSRTRFDDMVRLDLKYARAWSVWLDLKILAQTPAAVINGEGAH